MRQNKERWSKNALILVAAVVAVYLLTSFDLRESKSQVQGNNTSWDGSIRVFPAQLNRDSFGVVMVDTDHKTLWVYEFARGSARSQTKSLRLVAARNWLHDSMLENFNTAEPSPAEVKQMLEDLTVPEQVTEERDTEAREPERTDG